MKYTESEKYYLEEMPFYVNSEYESIVIYGFENLETYMQSYCPDGIDYTISDDEGAVIAECEAIDRTYLKGFLFFHFVNQNGDLKPCLINPNGISAISETDVCYNGRKIAATRIETTGFNYYRIFASIETVIESISKLI